MKIEELGKYDNFHLYYVDEISSTNDYLKTNYESFPDHSILWAKKQTKGRGRYDRVWISNDDITFSFLFKKPQNNQIIAPIAIVDALALYGKKAKIKWPNDVYLNDKKLSGILIEDIYLNGYQASIVGIGINHSNKDEVDGIGLNDINIDSKDLILKIAKYYDYLSNIDIKELVKKYKENNLIIGKKIIYQGKEYLAKEINDDGSLKLMSDTEIDIKCDEIFLKGL